MKQIKRKLADALSEEIGAEIRPEEIEIPENQDADFAYPAMKAGSALGKNPRDIAKEVAKKINLEILEEIKVAGPGYVNFHLKRARYSSRILETLSEEKMGVEQREGTLLLEFSSPNLAKPMHVGHLRNNVLGDSLQRIFRFVGYELTSENYIGDWGTQYGKVIYAFQEYGSRKKFEKNPMEHMYELYVEFHDREEPEMEEKGRKWSRRIEEGDEEAERLWEMFREATLKFHRQDYRRMGIEFDRWTGESLMVEGAKEILETGLKQGVFQRDDDGSLYIEFEGLPSTVLQRKDGATLYISRDLENLRKRKEDEGFDYNLILTGSEQDLHFQQVFEAARMLGLETEGCENPTYGLLNLEEGTMSSRQGNIIRLRDVLDEARERASKVEGREVDNAEAVGQAAVKYANLKVSREKDIEFSWDRALSFEGDSGPYLQYSNTRAKSILDKAENEGELEAEPSDPVYSLMKKLAEFPERVEEAADTREPAKVANYLSELCEEFNSFYHSTPVLDADPRERSTRILAVELFVEVTDSGLELLGIEPVEEM